MLLKDEKEASVNEAYERGKVLTRDTAKHSPNHATLCHKHPKDATPVQQMKPSLLHQKKRNHNDGPYSDDSTSDYDNNLLCCSIIKEDSHII